MAKWDWYQTTLNGSDPEGSGLVSHLLRSYPLSDWVSAKNLNGYHYGGAIRRGDHVLAHICWGGNPGINVKATSDDSPALAQAIRSFGREHRPTRVDACEDWYEEGLFDQVSAQMISFAQDKALAISQQGDWVRGQGRSLYLGAVSSPVRLVLYEKTYERRSEGFSGAPEHWVRLESRIRPKGQARELVASWEPENGFEAGWIPELLGRLGWQDLQKRSVGTVWKCSDAERARAALLRQYGAIMETWAEEEGGWDRLGLAMKRKREQMA